MAQRSQRGKRRDERSTDDEIAWNGFECKWLSMMVPDEVDIKHKVAKCGMCMVKEVDVLKRLK